MSNTDALILSRMGSSRLPGKALTSLCGKPVLQHIIERIKSVPQVNRIVVATTQDTQDDLIAYKCSQWGVECYRGSTNNVLSRCLGAVEHFDMQAVLRVGGDSPLLDPVITGRMIDSFLASKPDYLSNTLERSFPLGLDLEIFKAELFKRLSEIVQQLPEGERQVNEENVIPYLHQHPDEFVLENYKETPEFVDARLTLDTPMDFILIEKIYYALYPDNPLFDFDSVCEILNQHPDWISINKEVTPVSGFWTKVEKERFDAQYGHHNA